MLLSTSQTSDRDPDIAPALAALVDRVTEEYLRAVVERIAIPRHRIAEARANAEVARWIELELGRHGLATHRQGKFGNVVGISCREMSAVRVLVGAHFDTVPGSPGADDNASAVAAMLAVAKALSDRPGLPVAFVAFNREEDGLLGSKDFVKELVERGDGGLELVHILEMVGYADDRPGSQAVPAGLPVKLSDTGNFVGVLANRRSNQLVAPLLSMAARCTPGLPVTALRLFLGVEKLFPHLLRSDHSPFWDAGIPALMWTDTAEFRNPNYHKASDTPETLNWSFLCNVTRLLTAHVAERLGVAQEEGDELP